VSGPERTQTRLFTRPSPSQVAISGPMAELLMSLGHARPSCRPAASLFDHVTFPRQGLLTFPSRGCTSFRTHGLHFRPLAEDASVPWKECNVEDERLRFVARRLDGEAMAALCREFGVSRKTGHKIFSRYKETGLEGHRDRSRRHYRQANQLPFQIESLIVMRAYLSLEAQGQRQPGLCGPEGRSEGSRRPHLAGQLHALRPRLLRRRNLPPRARCKPLRGPQCVTHVSGMNRNRCVRNGPAPNGRSGGIRTPDPLLPKQVRYQAALRSANGVRSVWDTEDRPRGMPRRLGTLRAARTAVM
jgi:hypothetical protein